MVLALERMHGSGIFPCQRKARPSGGRLPGRVTSHPEVLGTPGFSTENPSCVNFDGGRGRETPCFWANLVGA